MLNCVYSVFLCIDYSNRDFLLQHQNSAKLFSLTMHGIIHHQVSFCLVVFNLIVMHESTLGDSTHTNSKGVCVALQSHRALFGCSEYSQGLKNYYHR